MFVSLVGHAGVQLTMHPVKNMFNEGSYRVSPVPYFLLGAANSVQTAKTLHFVWTRKQDKECCKKADYS